MHRDGGVALLASPLHHREPEPMSHRRLPPAAFLLLLAAAPLRADDAEDQAVKAVEKLGGTMVRDDNNPTRTIVEVDLSGTLVTDAGLKELAPLKGLLTLKLHHS